MNFLSKYKYIQWLAAGCLMGIGLKAHAQMITGATLPDSTRGDSTLFTQVDLGLRQEKAWRSTASTYTLDGKDLNRMFTGNLLNTLQGRIPGLTVVTGSGEPGYDSPTMYIRGRSSWNTNQVIILLDGFRVDQNALSALSPNEIASVTLLKDAASLSLYGLEGAGGVISVRTIKGKSMDKNQLVINGRYGIQSPIELPKVMNAYDYTRLYNEALANDGLPEKYPDPTLYQKSGDPYHPNVDWYQELLNPTSNIQDYNLSFRGGNRHARYFVLMDYTNYIGLYKNAQAIDKDFGTNAQYNKLNLRANVEIDLTKNLLVKANISGITEDRKTPAGFTASSLFTNLMRVPAAAFPVKNPNGSWGNSSVYAFNPIELLQQNGIYSAHTRTLQTDFTFRQKLDVLTQGLNLVGGVSFNNQYVGFYQTLFSVPSYEILKGADDQPVLGGDGQPTYKQIGSISQSSNDGGGNHWNRNTTQLGLNYDRGFGLNHYTGMLLAMKKNYSHNGQTYEVHTQGLTGNFTYDYAQKYILNVSAAYMGSADFQKGHRYGLFPSIGLGWVMSSEPFMQNSKAVDFLKLRASYGTTGSINEDYRFLYRQNAVGASGWIFGSNNAGKGGMTEGPFANPDATWEQKTILNLGVDVRLFKHLEATIDLFDEHQSGIYEVASADVPAFAGFNLPFTNSGVVDNTGLEAVITYRNQDHDFKYFVSGSFAYARNKIKEKSEDAEPFDYLYDKGYPINQTRGLLFDGYYGQDDFDAEGNLKQGLAVSSYGQLHPGDLKFKDLDGNGVINKYDMKPIGYTDIPEITLGFNLGFTYKHFDFDAFLQGVMNRSVTLLGAAYDYTHPFAGNNNITEFSKNYWTPETAATATSPRLSTLQNPNNDQMADYWMRNGNFLKLRSLELGYTFSVKKWLRGLEGIRVFASGTNLFTWDKLADLEAENVSMGYPLTKVVSFGFNVKF
ncbi:TonB-dependent receptor [Arachidicoccus ginsenosidivorans]|jgi:TonB-linked SusC/RagA family outer membrane protein|uniref:SusC/RagA family TonB-linked outer membrane protein n=1 Tax=Arachidicoccus ginsenosidivorans TaxID=496057 RepID=A0A5B8VM35_9BACT|nr:SusC/RagA family TonB-linked outer membrane protein [Arachidicoccus ginsenosidivorans]QEC72253.1 SusC/RagA family TonB-linked outer membrane protein [Arachidicoccus ginsenosidivorans]